MAMSNRDRIGTALEVFSAALEPFCARVIGPHLPPGTTWPDVLRVKDEVGGGGRGVYEPCDPQVQLRVLTETLGELGNPFGATLPRTQQDLAGDLRQVHNKWAHQGPFGHDDTYRALDTMERLLQAIGASAGADEVRRQRLSLQRVHCDVSDFKDVSL